VARTTLYIPDMPGSEQVELLVDTGSTYTWVSDEALRGLSVEAKFVR